MRKSQTTTKNIFFTLTFLYRKFYNLFENIWKNLVYIVTFALQLLYVAGYWKTSNKTKRACRYALVL